MLAIPDILSRPHVAIFPSLYIDEPRRHLNNLQFTEIDQDVLALLLALYQHCSRRQTEEEREKEKESLLWARGLPTKKNIYHSFFRTSPHLLLVILIIHPLLSVYIKMLPPDDHLEQYRQYAERYQQWYRNRRQAPQPFDSRAYNYTYTPRAGNVSAPNHNQTYQGQTRSGLRAAPVNSVCFTADVA